jgi:hypothetical protein
VPRPSLRVLAPAAALGAPLLLAALLTSVAAPATGSTSAARHTAAPGYQVMVTTGAGGAHPATVLPTRGSGLAAPAVTLRFGAKDLPLAVPGSGHGSFAVSALAHAGHSGMGSSGRRGPRVTLTIKGTNPAGQPDTGDLVIVGDVANANAPGTGFGVFKNGTAKFHVPPGTYWAAANFAQVSGTKLVGLRVDLLPQFKVAGNTTVQAKAAAATEKVTMATPRPAVHQSLTLTFVRAAPHARPAGGLSSKINSLEDSVGNTALWVNPVSTPPSYGTLRVFTSAQLTSPAGHGTPYTYTLNFANPPGTIPAQHFVARQAGLAAVPERYVQDQHSVAAWQTFDATPYQIDTSFVGALDLPLRLPTRQVQYMSASPAMYTQTFYSEYRTIKKGETPGGQTDAFRLRHPGQQPAQAWGAYPLHPGTNISPPHTPFVVVSSADRAGNTLNLDVTPFTDNQPGHTGAGLVVPFPGKTNEVSGRYAVYQNGTKVAGGNAVKATGGFGDVQVSAALAAKPALIKFVLSASRASAPYPLSATSNDVWTWHSRPEPGAHIPAPWLCNFAAVKPSRDRHCAVQPMITLGYSVAGLGADGATKPGHQAITITAGHIQLAPRIPVTKAGVQVSVNGGKTWKQANVAALGGGRFKVTFTAPASAQVSLRSTAHDPAGDGLTETILSAYQTAA